MQLRTLCAFALAAAVIFCVAPTAGIGQQPEQPNKEDALRAKVRELEERVARLEKQLATAPATATPTSEAVPIGDVTTNLSEERLQRYLRIKISLKTEDATRKEVSDAVAKRRAELKNWLIGYLADKTLRDVSGQKGLERLRADMKAEFARILFPTRKGNPIVEVLFEEYVVQ